MGLTAAGAFGKKPGGLEPKDEHGLLEGISSLHSWIKSQTMIRPNRKAKTNQDVYDPVLSLILL